MHTDDCNDCDGTGTRDHGEEAYRCRTCNGTGIVGACEDSRITGCVLGRGHEGRCEPHCYCSTGRWCECARAWAARRAS